MDYVKIPQNVRVADKLIGPLSMKQIMIIAVGGGISYSIFAVIQKSMGAVPTAAHLFIWIPAILAAAFAVIRINDIPLSKYLLLIIETSVKPKVRVWQPRRGTLVLPSRTAHTKKKKKEEGKEGDVQNESPVKLQDLSVILDTGGTAEKKQERSLDELGQAMDHAVPEPEEAPTPTA